MKLSLKDRLSVLFTGSIRKAHPKKNIPPVDYERYYLIWYNADEKWFEVFDHNNKFVIGLMDVIIADNWEMAKDGRHMNCTFKCFAVMVDNKPIQADE